MGLSRKILALATSLPSRHEFMGEICRLLADLSACDRVVIWLGEEKGRSQGWSYSHEEDLFCPLGMYGGDGNIQESVQGEDGLSSRAELELDFGEEVLGRIVLHSRRSDFFNPAKLDLYRDVAQQLAVAIAYQRVQHSQQERVKELSCLYRIARIAGQPDQDLDTLLSRVVHVLPPAWQYPEISFARIKVSNMEFFSGNVLEAVHSLKAIFDLPDGGQGVIEVSYSQECPPLYEGPFLAEERHLLEAVARELGLAVARKHAEANQKSLQEQLEHADRLATIGQLASGVAHELNEPLGSILGFAQLAAKDSRVSEQVLRDLTRIEAAALYSREIVRKLKLFARQAPSQQKALDLNVVIDEGLLFLESRLAKQGIELRLELNRPLPPVVADSGQIVQVIMNLGVNAAQAMDGGGEIVIGTSFLGQEVLLEVSDDGPGIPKEQRKKVFEPFFSTKEVGEGTGLGLSVVHGIVSAHGGRIELDRSSGGGARFRVFLPCEEPP